MEDLVQVVKSQLKEKNLQGMLEVYNIQESSLSSSEDDEESSILERSDLWLVKCDRRGWMTVDIEASIKKRNYSFFMLYLHMVLSTKLTIVGLDDYLVL